VIVHRQYFNLRQCPCAIHKIESPSLGLTDCIDK
jgi:hypothetical protein